MTSLIATSPEQFIFAQNSELKTNSLKIAEAFGKEHSNVIKVIERTLTQVSDSFGKVNFNATEYEQNNNLGLPAKYKMYEMTKDGFMFLVMGFTGKKAAGIKESYINAFNLMHKKLFPVREALVVLPKLTPSHQRHIQDVVKALVNTQVGSTYSIVWGSVKKHFDVGTYKDIPEVKYPELCEFLKCELLPAKQFPQNTEFGQRFITRVCGNETETVPVPDGAFVLTPEQIKNNLHEILPGYRLLDKETNAIFTVLKNQIIEQSQNKGTPA